MRAARPGVEARRDPTMEIFATSWSTIPSLAMPADFHRSTRCAASSANSSSRTNVMRPRPFELALWMISRTQMFSPARSWNTRAARPGSSGTSRSVIFAIFLSLLTPHDLGLLHHHIVAPADPRALARAKARPHVDRNVVRHAQLGGPGMQHLGAARRHLDGRLVADLGPQPRAGHQVGIGREHAVDVRADLARVGAHGHRHRDARDVAAPPAQGRDVMVGRHALEAVMMTTRPAASSARIRSVSMD